MLDIHAQSRLCVDIADELCPTPTDPRRDRVLESAALGVRTFIRGDPELTTAPVELRCKTAYTRAYRAMRLSCDRTPSK